MREQMGTTASVLICCYDAGRWRLLTEAIASSVQQQPRPAEVLVVVDHNEELRGRLLDHVEGCYPPSALCPPVRVLTNEFAPGLSGARNSGVRAATGDVVCFLDDDATAADGWLSALTAPFAEHKDVVATGGWVSPNFEYPVPTWLPKTYFWVFGCSYEGLPPNGATLRNPIGASMAMRRRNLQAAGGFSSAVGRTASRAAGCEETELGIRLGAEGGRIVHATSSVVSHFIPQQRLSWRYFAQRCFDEGRSKATVSSLVGASSALASERRHVLRLFRPRAWVADSIRSSAQRLTASIVGVALASIGYGVESIRHRLKFTA